MPDYEQIANSLKESDPNVVSVAIIEGSDKIAYSTPNWDALKDLEQLFSNWGVEMAKYIEISGAPYRILQNTSEKFVALSVQRKNNIIGYKDDERKIVYKITTDGSNTRELLVQSMNIITQAARALRLMSSKGHYIPPGSSMGKSDQIKEVSTKFFFDTTEVLQRLGRLGLQKFGLSPEEAMVYLALLKRGEKGDKVGNLDKELDIKRTTIYRIIDRLVEKKWIEKRSETPKGIQTYAAKPIIDIINKTIKEKEEEIKVLKSFRLLTEEFINKDLENLPQIYKDAQSFGKEVFDIDVLGIMGLEKDFGIIIFEYEGITLNDDRVRDKLALLYNKIKEQIEKLKSQNKIQDFESMDIEYEKVEEYLGATIYLKFKEGSETVKKVGSDWVVAIKQVAIPIYNNIYVIWGSEEKFQNLVEVVLKLKA